MVAFMLMEILICLSLCLPLIKSFLREKLFQTVIYFPTFDMLCAVHIVNVMKNRIFPSRFHLLRASLSLIVVDSLSVPIVLVKNTIPSFFRLLISNYILEFWLHIAIRAQTNTFYQCFCSFY